MKDFIKRYKIILSSVIFSISILGLANFVIKPLVNKIASKADSIQQEKTNKELNEIKLASVSTMEKDFSRFKDEEGRLNIIIDQEKELDFIKELELLAEQTGNRIEFRVEDEMNNARVKAKKNEVSIKDSLKYKDFLSMQIALEGDYTNLLNFINKLENYKNYVNIISISSEKKTIGSPNGLDAEEKVKASEVINSILGVAVYLRPVSK